jgi:hypothetical protein
MTILKLSIAALVALLAGAWAEQAKADETFVCPDGGLVHAKSEDVPHLKRTNPCVAAYFGLTVSAVHPADSHEAAKAANAAGAPPSPATRPAGPAAGDASPARQSAAAPPKKPPSDYRNVHVLNGGNGGGSWFRPPN